MQFKFIKPLGPEYDEERMLRWEALSKPLGLPPGSEIVPADEKSLHLIAIDKKKIVGCVCFCAENTARGEIFHMAVSEEYQGRGFGRKLIHKMEQELVEKGVSDIYVYARQENEGFYSKMGYHSEGDYITRNGLSCRLMKKHLHV